MFRPGVAVFPIWNSEYNQNSNQIKQAGNIGIKNHGGCEIGLWNRVKSFQNRDTVPLKDFRELK